MFVGPTLSQWIDKMRQREDAESALILKRVRKLLEVLAHDVLKHRLLGLSSLAQQLNKLQSEGTELTKEQLDDFRGEMFRLCGARSEPSERLWQKWHDTFYEIRRLAHYMIISPFVDPTLRGTTRVMVKLRALFSLFISKERADAVTPAAIKSLDLAHCDKVYTDIFEMASACQMIIEPVVIVKRAIDTLCSQTGRRDAASRIHVEVECEGRYMSSASTQTLVMCLVRVVDNALTQSGSVLVCAKVMSDEFSGESFLTFRVYDECDDVPDSMQYGLGLRGVQREITEFDGGFMFKREVRGVYKKAAVISLPVSDYQAIVVQKPHHSRIVLFIILNIFFSVLLLTAGVRIVGGPPVAFAGGGVSVIEFPVEAGHELVMPLCVGGSNVSAEIEIGENTSCLEGSCSLYSVIEGLKPCREGLNNAGCPGELRWTPQFEDGLRQGKSYEITVHCISAGPPRSEDIQNVRLLVSRKNSRPQLVQLKVENLNTGVIRNLEPDNNFLTVDVAIGEKFLIRALAVDPDSDTVKYRLKLPHGDVVTSFDGVFTPDIDWEDSEYAINTLKVDQLTPVWRVELSATDNIDPAIRRIIKFKANQFRNIEVREISVKQQDLEEYQLCYNASDTQFLCQLGAGDTTEVRMDVWIDPLAPLTFPKISVVTGEGLEYSVRTLHARPADSASVIGDSWEVYSVNGMEPYAVIEFVKSKRLSVDGMYQFVFNIRVSHEVEQLSSLPVEIHLADPNGKVGEYRGFLMFARKNMTRQETYSEEPVSHVPSKLGEVQDDENTQVTVPRDAEAAVI